LPVWSALIDQLRVTAPHAWIVVVGYGTFVRSGGCFPAQPVLPRDADYLQSKLNELDDLQEQLAGKKAIDYFDTRLISRGHDICAAPNDRYIEGFVTTGPLFGCTPMLLASPPWGMRSLAISESPVSGISRLRPITTSPVGRF